MYCCAAFNELLFRCHPVQSQLPAVISVFELNIGFLYSNRNHTIEAVRYKLY